MSLSRHATATFEETSQGVEKAGAEDSLQLKKLKCVTLDSVREAWHWNVTGLVRKVQRLGATADGTKHTTSHFGVHQREVFEITMSYRSSTLYSAIFFSFICV